MSSESRQKTEEMDNGPVGLQSPRSTNETVEHPESEAASLKNLRGLGSGSLAGKISVALLIPGILSLIVSILNNSQVLAFVGLGLTFWGALFLLVRPTTYVQGNLLDSTAISFYTTIDRITTDLKYRGKSFYIPPYPKQANLPDHLKGLKEMIVFISANGSASLPSIEEMVESKFMLQNPKGISIAPPGSGLLDQFENKLSIDHTQFDLQTLCGVFPQLILENFQLAKEIEMKPEDSQVNLKIVGSIFRGLYLAQGLKSVYSCGCPLVSALVCLIAKTTGKIVTIDSSRLDQQTDTIEVSCRIIKG